MGASTARKKQESQYDETKPKGLNPRYHEHLRVVDRGLYSNTENAAGVPAIEPQLQRGFVARGGGGGPSECLVSIRNQSYMQREWGIWEIVSGASANVESGSGPLRR